MKSGVKQMTDPVVADAIGAVHAALVAWIVAVPFVGGREELRAHAYVLPFLWLHWFTNQDACVLTVAERAARGVPNDRSFFHALVSPVYKLTPVAAVNLGVWYASIALWGVTCWKLL